MESLFSEMRKKSPKVTGSLLRMREESYKDGKVPAKIKLLTALAISVSLRCEPCIKAYAKMAKDKGATEDEVLEFLNVAMTMNGCPGEEWALKAYGFFKGLAEGERSAKTPDSCCQD